jgi:nucleoside-triphosphatase
VKPHLLITAVPGAGKTTVIRRVAAELDPKTVGGFDGNEVVIAHVDLPKTNRVVDEIGKMECLSERFVASMRRLLAGKVPVVATIARRGGGFIAEVKRHAL